jgi:hypothetical protein
VYDSQSNMEVKVNSVLRNCAWCWKPARLDELVDIQSRLPEVHLGAEDKPVWTISHKGVFVSSDTWDFMRKRKQEFGGGLLFGSPTLSLNKLSSYGLLCLTGFPQEKGLCLGVFRVIINACFVEIV